jgi:hypothetical protein
LPFRDEILNHEAASYTSFTTRSSGATLRQLNVSKTHIFDDHQASQTVDHYLQGAAASPH